MKTRIILHIAKQNGLHRYALSTTEGPYYCTQVPEAVAVTFSGTFHRLLFRIIGSKRNSTILSKKKIAILVK